MKRMPASVFKARCLAVIRDVEASGEPVMVTKRGVPLVKVVPMKSKKDLLGYMAGKFKITGDIESPIWGKSAGAGQVFWLMARSGRLKAAVRE